MYPRVIIIIFFFWLGVIPGILSLLRSVPPNCHLPEAPARAGWGAMLRVMAFGMSSGPRLCHWSARGQVIRLSGPHFPYGKQVAGPGSWERRSTWGSLLLANQVAARTRPLGAGY